MLARILDPESDAIVLVCGPHWSSRCGAAGEDARTAFCAGQTALVDHTTPEGTKMLRVSISPQQRSCPFGPPRPRAV